MVVGALLIFAVGIAEDRLTRQKSAVNLSTGKFKRCSEIGQIFRRFGFLPEKQGKTCQYRQRNTRRRQPDFLPVMAGSGHIAVDDEAADVAERLDAKRTGGLSSEGRAWESQFKLMPLTRRSWEEVFADLG